MGKRIKYNLIYVLLGPDRSAYVGQTSDPVNRRSRYKTLTCKNQRLVYASLLKHGHDKHKFKELLVLPDDSTREQMDFYEIFYHSLYKELGYTMMNLKSPGWNGVSPKESNQMGASKRKGRKPWNAGTKGLIKSWNTGLSIPRRSYTVKKGSILVQIDNLKQFCKENELNYTTMVHFLSGKGQYEKRTHFQGYERV